MKETHDMVASAVFRVTTHPEIHSLSVAGDFDMGDVETFRAALAEVTVSSRHTVTIDLEGLTYLGSAGLGELIRAAASGTGVQLANVPAHMRRILDLTQTAELFSGPVS